MKWFALGMAIGFGIAPAHADTLNLVCLGAGSANRQTNTYGSFGDSNGNSAWGNVVGNKDVPFDDQVNIEINEDGTGKIRMPRAMLPRIRGGKDGWFEIEKIVKGEDEITGVVQVNFINSPKLRIDRIRGHVSISGKAGDYSGMCQPYDPKSVHRAF